MTTIALRKYNELINSLIDQEKYQEAIGHCTAILNSYPKCIDTYQSLGRALLENKLFEEAEKVFSKILSVFPEDFSAHAALSEINEENRELDRAIWHMERAFETQPSNLNVQEEMRRLIGRRDGTPPAKVRLTRGALIRMYAKGDLYQQAIAETLSALEADPDRIDLKVLLARFYHTTGANTEAASTCAEILAVVPYCLEANRIMFDLSSQSNEYKFDPLYQERLSELDPYYRFVENGKQDVKSISEEKIILDVIDFVPDHTVTYAEPDWAQKIGLSWQEVLDESVTKETTDIDGLDYANPEVSAISTDAAQAIPFIEDYPEETQELKSETPDSTEDSIPDWIAKAGWIRATDEEVPSTPFETSPAGLVAETDNVPAEPASDLPDWLKTLNPENLDSPEVLTPTGDIADLDAEIPPLTPDMLNEFLADDDIKADDSSTTFDQEAISEQEVLVPTDEASDQIESITDEEIPELPDWLKDLDTGEINVSEDLAFAPENTTFINPESRSEMADFIDELSSTNLLEPEDMLPEVQDELAPVLPTLTIEEEITEPETLESAPSKIEFTPVSSESIEKVDVKPAVPSWVSKILAGSAAVTPIINTASSKPEPLPVVSGNPEESIPELITELPEIESGEGVISNEVNKELESWLSEIIPDETQPIESPIESTLSLPEETKPFESEIESVLPPAEEAASPLITFDNLVEPLENDENLEVEAILISEPVDLEGELIDSSSTLQDRLSSMLGIEESPEIPEITPETVSIVEQPIKESGLKEKLSQLLHSGEYNSFINSINVEDLPVETADEVISEINEELKNKPETFELWQSLGDIQSKKDNIVDALSAYKEAEKYLFQ